MKNKSKGVMVGLQALLLAGSFTVAMSPAMAQTQALDVGEDAGVRESPAPNAAAARKGQIQAPASNSNAAAARPAPSVNAVKAPPRPKGSSMVVIGAGLNPVELKRQKKAHSSDKIVKKDPTRDDSLPVRPSPVKK